MTSVSEGEQKNSVQPLASGPRLCVLPQGLDLVSGRRLEHVEVAYETFGELDEQGSNAILICHALSGDAHVAAGSDADGVERPGWWDVMVGPGMGIDTRKYFVICSNVIGGCSGSTGPASADPATGTPYGLRFPLVTVEDMVAAQAGLLDQLGVKRLLAVVGGSMGGMQALAWAKLYPERVRTCIGVASTPRLAAQAIAFNEVGRTAILSDVNFAGGDYYGAEQPANGLAIARMVGHITYLSDESMRDKFGRRLQTREDLAFDFVTEFEVESYLAHQGRKFVERFDANTYLYMTKAMDYFDLAAGADSLADALDGTPARFLLLTFSSDWLFPTYQTRLLVDALRRARAEVSFAEIESPYGHDAFLLEPEEQRRYIEPFLECAHEESLAEKGGAL
ncbi:MAG: homoserine O-acetyltransferase [Coriobacteriia bacterium]|nr:homoserine O-acetyltransferase [Coriobacteriia bacterium]